MAPDWEKYRDTSAWHTPYKTIQEHLQMINTMDLRWVCKSSNGLVDRISNKGVSKDGLVLDTTWLNIPKGQFRIDCLQLVTKECDNNFSKECHIKEGCERPRGWHEGPRQKMTTQHVTTNHNAGLDYTTGESTTTRSCQH
jgi:hypothetical protein